MLDVPAERRGVALDWYALDELSDALGRIRSPFRLVHVACVGAVDGDVILVYDDASEDAVVDGLLGEGGAAEGAEAEGRSIAQASVLAEVGNLLASQLMNRAAEASGLELEPSVPQSSFDYPEAIMSAIQIRHGLGVGEAPVLRVTWHVGDRRERLHLHAIFEAEGFERICAALATGGA